MEGDHQHMTAPTPLPARDLRITLRKKGATRYTRMSFPLYSGIYSEIETRHHLLHFNLNNEIIRAKGKGGTWHHPHEWLKRNMGNDWIYYSTGGYTGVFEATGEYYLPNLPYLTNGLLGGNPFRDETVAQLAASWYQILAELSEHARPLSPDERDFLQQALANTPELLAAKADRLFGVCGGRSTVLPPDARHVDYNVIPVTVATGCLYKCRFCEVKNKRPFKALTVDQIEKQLQALTDIYLQDLANYNALFLGEHDALQAGPELLLKTLDLAWTSLSLAAGYIREPSVFLFGSATSLLNTPRSFFQALEERPYRVYINIGLESADQKTLEMLGKPLTSQMVTDTFDLMQEINERFTKTEVTANFVLDDELPPGHLEAFSGLVRDRLARPKPKGCIYLSPLRFGQPSRSKTFEFNRLKLLSRLPTYLYIIQRL